MGANARTSLITSLCIALGKKAEHATRAARLIAHHVQDGEGLTQNDVIRLNYASQNFAKAEAACIEAYNMAMQRQVVK